jgi:hypothetical protein
MRLASTIGLHWRLLRATPAQRVAVGSVLGGPVAVPPQPRAEADRAHFNDVERVLSLALDDLINTVDAYRERKGARSV